MLVKQFLVICSEINFLLAMEKTEWAPQVIVFLGMLLDSINQTVSISIDKRDKALNLLQDIGNSRTVTIIKLQQLAVLLNYLSWTIIPAHSFTRNFYLMTKDLTKKPHHHINTTHEMRLHCFMWIEFLKDCSALCRPFIDFDAKTVCAEEINMLSDVSGSIKLGFRAAFDNEWCCANWEEQFIEDCKPSIEYLEFYALAVAVHLWAPKLANCRVIGFCDNTSVCHMVNTASSSCSNCLYLL